MNVVIIGANRGIGLGFVKHYLQQGCQVWASHRQSLGGLADIDEPALRRFQWDVAAPHPEAVIVALGLPERIDLLINSGGIYGPKKNGQELDEVTARAMQEVFMVDAVGPLMTVKALKGRVIQAGGRIANISSKMGSCGDNTSGGTYAYRAAKAALVMISKSLAIDLAPDHIRVISLHPGWVRTDMTDHGGLIDIADSVAGMAQVIAAMEHYPAGALVGFDGQLIPY